MRLIVVKMVEENYVKQAEEEALSKGLKSISYYVLDREVGDGVAAKVWLARDVKEKELVCVKIFKTENEQAHWQVEVDFMARNLYHVNVL